MDLAKALELFEQTTMFWHFDQVFRKNMQKVPHFMKKHEKSSIWTKVDTLLKELPCLCILTNFSEKGCEKCLVSWKRTKNHPFGQNYGTFPTNYHVLTFKWSFQQKLAKSASFHEKGKKIVDLAKTLHLFEQCTMFLHFDQVLRKWLGKVPHFVIYNETSSIW